MTHRNGAATVTVNAVSPGASVQDLGRTGHMHVGVSPSGAADVCSFTLANRLVGNPENAACFEVLLGGFSITLSSDRVVAVTGAPVSVHIDGRVVPDTARMLLPAGARLELGRPVHGIRTYVAVAGGVEAPQFLGSASNDALGGIGSGMAAGQQFALGRPDRCPDLPTELALSRIPDTGAVLRMHWGPRHDLFDASDRRRLVSQWWQVSDRTDRVAARLTGDPLTIGSIALPSEGMVRGSIEIPPSGEPIVFLSDHPATGGYPVIGVVLEADADVLAQARPGLRIRFDPVTPTEQ
ncbi:biotin-dependent carboxyltransferase [Rhodococcus sp. WS4]|nr:biotin-dependent carboxyltransferase [Rhodococcus sp. WS4]